MGKLVKFSDRFQLNDRFLLGIYNFTKIRLVNMLYVDCVLYFLNLQDIKTIESYVEFIFQSKNYVGPATMIMRNFKSYFW